MRKKIILLLIGICTLLIGSLIYFNKDNIGEHFWRKIDNQLDYERSLEVGDDFNKISWGDLSFQINHHKGGNNLEYVSTVNKEKYILLKNVSSYKILNGCLYVKSLYGYAIVDENDFCRIYTDSSDNEQLNNYSYDSEGNKVYDSQILKNERIEYLSEYEEFDKDEKEIFKKMLK